MEHGCGQALSVHVHEEGMRRRARGQPCTTRGLQGSGWEQPVGSMHRCIELRHVGRKRPRALAHVTNSRYT